MQNFIVELLSISLSMSVLALLYIAVSPLLARRYSEKGRYYAWLIIVLGLIIPFRPQFENVVVESPVIIQQIENPVHIIVVPVFDSPAPVSVLPTAPVINWWQVAFSVWFVGLATFLLYHAVKHYRFMQMLKRWNEKITDSQTLAMLQGLKAEMGIKRNIDIYQCESIGSPMMLGFITPRILLPKADFTESELRFILRHELVHYTRKDLHYKCLVLLASAIHWFNPVVYVMARAINVQCEMSCDAETMKNEDADSRQNYSKTIITVAKMQTALSTNFYGGKKGMKKRITSIMDTRKKKMGAAIFCAVLVVTLGAGFLFAPAPEVQEAEITIRKPNEMFLGSALPRDITEMFLDYEEWGIEFVDGWVYMTDEGTIEWIRPTETLYRGQHISRFADDGIGLWFDCSRGSIDVTVNRNENGYIIGLDINDAVIPAYPFAETETALPPPNDPEFSGMVIPQYPFAGAGITVQESVGWDLSPYRTDRVIERTIPITPLTYNGRGVTFWNPDQLHQAIYYEMGNIMFPTYIPEGFGGRHPLIGVVNARDWSDRPPRSIDGCYKHLNQLLVRLSDGENAIGMHIDFLEPNVYMRPVDYEHPITINGMDGRFFIPCEERYWLNTSLTLFDSDSRAMYGFFVGSDSDVPVEVLIRMAESMERVMQ